ncbi:MAG TPA: ABC transporter ATP-binding protein [Chitinophagales bacterium]|nr:ABC transporter ATP-binding protein [Chitinophagales bacterium]HRG27929.1 ABC transporter ATP-binding protein [Chitinophagales bacterium]HRG84718.1 ABC transporter ATP-binding protein [Chitinophagales bacterium]
MLKVNSITKTFDQFKAVNGISLSLTPGMFYGLLGPNGAGKTTTIHMISAIMPPDTGDIQVAGIDVYTQQQKVKMHMGVVPQEIALYDELSAFDNLLFWGSLYGITGADAKKQANYLLEWVGLADRKNDSVRTYSGGMKRRVNIASALMHNPGLIVMDEPTVGIDPQSRNKIYELLDEMHAGGKTILYTTHYMEEAEKMCDKIGVIDSGKIIAEGSLNELKTNYSLDDTVVITYSGKSDGNIAGFATQHNEELNEIVIQIKDAKGHLSDIVNKCAMAQIAIHNIDIKSSGLEAIFLHLTGKQLRD